MKSSLKLERFIKFIIYKTYLYIIIDPFAPEPPVTARTDPRSFYPL